MQFQGLTAACYSHGGRGVAMGTGGMRPWAEFYWCIVKSSTWSNVKGQQVLGGPAPPHWASRSSFPCSSSGCSFVPSVSCSPLGQYDTRRFRQLLCPDLSCEVCNNVTAEVNQLLFPDGLEDATSSASPLASRDSVTKSSSTLSPAFSAVSPGDPIPAPLPEPFPPPPRILSPLSLIHI